MTVDKLKYTESSIEVLEGLKAVRIRPAMYIGTTSSRGLHHLIWEIVDNCIDEALAGYCTTVNINIDHDSNVTVSDNGRGIPTGVHAKTKKSTVETILTELHAGGKFSSRAYKVSGGLHGVGASVVNALSTSLKVTVYRDGFEYFQEFKNGGIPNAPLKQVGPLSDPTQTGTTITFHPDPKIFVEGIKFDANILKQRLKELAFLNPGITINFKFDSAELDESYHYEGGINAYVAYLNEKTAALHDNFYMSSSADDVNVEISLQYTEGDWVKVYSFCNNIQTKEGGTHEEGFRYALGRTLNNYVKNNRLIDHKLSLTYDDIKEGLTAIINIKHMDPQYEGQTKTKLGNYEVRQIVNRLFSAALEKYLLENPQVAAKISEKCVVSLKARLAAKKAREQAKRKSALNTFNLPGKLADCISSNVDECELFVVEGDSAGTTAKLGRDSYYQAILPLKGKVLNVERAKIEHIYDNDEISSLITAIGAGFDDTFDIEKIKYHKIIIMTDADVDGDHIKILLLTLFYRYMQPLITAGHIYVACPPLYRVFNNKKSYYAADDKDLQAKIKLLGTSKYTIQRFKGLGEMNAEQLSDTTMSPKNRVLIKVNIANVIEADRIFSRLMGHDSKPRKEFIFDKSDNSLNLDI